MNERKLFFFALSVVAFNCFSQHKVKRVVTKERGYPRSLEIKWVVKKGEHKGKKHGQYSLSNNGKSSSGKYFLDQKDAEWKYTTKTSKHSEFFTKGKLDSSKGYFDTKFFTLLLDQNGDTTKYETWFSNGISYNKIGDTTYVTDKINKVVIGKIINDKREGQWNWTTATGTATTAYKNGKPTGVHTSYYKNGQKLCEKTYDNQGSLQGSYIVYYQSGDTAMIEHYANGKRHGEAKAWFENKNVLYQGTFIHGKLIDYQELSDEGDLNILSQVTAGTGTLIHKNEEETIEYPISNGLINGTVTTTTSDSVSLSDYITGMQQLKNENKCYAQEDIDTSFIELNYRILNSDWYKKASFPKGDEGLQRFLAENINFPRIAIENDIQGKVEVLFVVDQLGEVTSIETCNKTLGFGLEEESIRVLQATSYLWTPATINGFPMNMRFRIPVKYQIF